jgi:hypothetical protein
VNAKCSRTTVVKMLLPQTKTGLFKLCRVVDHFDDCGSPVGIERKGIVQDRQNANQVIFIFLVGH